MEIAADEPFGGYAWDGDQRWTPEAVRLWWAGRESVRAWSAEELDDRPNEKDDGLEDYLRGYLFWLIENREPRTDEELPTLSL